uniref:GRAM domain-containing protein n=1 Tax=Globisporangium ultimum (strain ATCC 200006 / CBS 805.95 / DAOM BR144) TaxID=431595 RepID=K3X0E3_GLOUD
MSFTVQLFAAEDKLLPLANEDELFILERAKISFQTKSPDHTFKGKGRVYCTTQRIIFVAERGSMQHGLFFEAFEIPLMDMTDEKFNQPIFGACSISGVVKPRNDESAPFSWKIIFDNGGTGVVLPVFLKLLEKRKKQGTWCCWLGQKSPPQATIIDMNFVQNQKRAFVDPNDPTVIYIAQPVKPSDSATRST